MEDPSASLTGACGIPRGRFAPSPTGPLHLGSLVAALASYLNVRAAGGEWLIRIEDIDPPREPPGAREEIVAQLHAYQLHADQPVIFQSQRLQRYRAVLQHLIERELAFPCFCTRSQLAGRPHRGRCHSTSRNQPSWRLLVHPQTIGFLDQIQGQYAQDLQQEVGDFVLWRADGWPAYQLACVVDDADDGITEVVRGMDLIDSTPRQIYLQRLLGFPQPSYAHLPLVLGADGQKLSKQNLATPLAVTPESILPNLQLAHHFLSQRSNARTQPAAWLVQAARDWQLEQIQPIANSANQ